MDNTSNLVAAMAERCRELICESEPVDTGLPQAVQRKHLLWMCDQIEKHAEGGNANKLHRWIGFVQGAMLANRMLDLDELRAMFDEAQAAHAVASEAMEDLTDHLDPTSSFEFDIGGEG